MREIRYGSRSSPNWLLEDKNMETSQNFTEIGKESTMDVLFPSHRKAKPTTHWVPFCPPNAQSARQDL